MGWARSGFSFENGPWPQRVRSFTNSLIGYINSIGFLNIFCLFSLNFLISLINVLDWVSKWFQDIEVKIKLVATQHILVSSSGFAWSKTI